MPFYCVPCTNLLSSRILARLREEGWGEELRSMPNWALEDMSDLPHVRQSKSLTEGGKGVLRVPPRSQIPDGAPLLSADWPKVMRSLKGILDARRESLIADRYRMCVRRRFKVLEAAIVAHCVQLPRTPSMLCHPTPLDLALMPECRAVLERPLSDTVVQDDLKPIVPALVERWETDVRSKLTDYLVRHMGQVAPGVDPLTLAIGVFTCSVRCVDDRMDLPMPAGAMQYPAILHHACLRRGRRAFPSEEDDLLARTIMRLDLTAAGIRAYERMHGAASYCDVPFDVGMLEEGPAAPAAIGRMRRIVSALGLDPACATIGELKACTSRLYCSRCHASKVHRPNVHIHDWQSAVRPLCPLSRFTPIDSRSPTCNLSLHTKTDTSVRLPRTRMPRVCGSGLPIRRAELTVKRRRLLSTPCLSIDTLRGAVRSARRTRWTNGMSRSISFLGM